MTERRWSEWRMGAVLAPVLLLVLWLAAFAPPAAAQTGVYDAEAAEAVAAEQSGAAEGEGADPAADPAPPLSIDDYLVADGFESGEAIRSATRGADVFRDRLAQTVMAVPTIFAQMNATLEEKSPNGDAAYFLGVLLFTAALLVIGRAFTILFGVFVGRPIMVSLQKPNPQGYIDKLPVLGARMVITLVGALLALLVAAGIGFAFFEGHEPTQITAALLMFAFAAGLMIDTSWRMIISPYLPDYRIPAFTDEEAVKLYRWLSIITAFGILSLAFTAWTEAIEMPSEVRKIITIAISIAGIVVFLAGIYRNKSAITAAILERQSLADAPWPARVTAVLWAPVVTAYVVLAWAAGNFRVVMDLPGGVPLMAGLFFTFLLAIAIYALIVYVVERAFARSRRRREMNRQAALAEAEAREMGLDEGGEDEISRSRADGDVDSDGDDEGGGPPVVERERFLPPDLDRSSIRTYEDLARRVASLVALGVAGWLLALTWIGPGIFAEGSAFDTVQDIVDTLLIGYVIYHVARIWIDDRIMAEGGDEIAAEPGDEGGGASAASRIATLLPLIRAFVLATIAASIALLIALELGVNVAPLFAGAGVVGLAIGFGAQTLVRDILSGMFFLLDDAFRKGEYIDVGAVKGTVEKISLRSFQLRHHLGALHTIPFGEITHLTNFSRDWVMMKLPLRLTYDTDVEKVRKLVKKLGQALLEHPDEGYKFVQPLKSQGVYMMEDSAMIIRVKYMTRPGDQWTTRKLVYAEIRKLFEQEGIKFAHREVTVRIPELEGREDTLDGDTVRAVGAAARRAVDDIDMETADPQVATAR
ncbi:MAG: mechanosensitive ion channel family protein [Pseudomonadota bacterium]